MANFLRNAPATSQVLAGVNPSLKTNFFPTPNVGISDDRGVKIDSLIKIFPEVLNTRSVNGVKAKSYVEDFYYKIRYLPFVLNIGSLTSAQTRELYVFNGYFESKTLDNLTLLNADGLQVDGPSTPTVYNALQVSLYNLSIGTEGPSSIDASIIFDWEVGVLDETVRVFGSRSIAIPYLFQPGTTETLSWKTEVMTSDNGTERRTRVRKSPRQSFNFNLNTPHGQNAILDNILYAWRGNVFALPVSTQSRKSTSATSTTSDLLSVNTDYAEFRVGGIAVVYESENNFEIFQIKSFTQNEIVADRNFIKVISAGALVMPAISAKLDSNPRRIFNGYQSGLNAAFTSLTNAELASSASDIQYKGIDVFLDEVFLENENSTDVYSGNVTTVDYETGLQEIFSSWTNTKIDRRVVVYMDSLEEAWNFRVWLHRRAGKLRPFYMPTHENNFEIVSTGLIGASFNVVDYGQLTLLGNRLSVAIQTTSGWHLADIVPPVVQSGNFLSITIDSPVNVDRSLILGMSYLDKKRLSSDNIEIQWLGNSTSSCTLPLINTD